MIASSTMDLVLPLGVLDSTMEPSRPYGACTQRETLTTTPCMPRTLKLGQESKWDIHQMEVAEALVVCCIHTHRERCSPFKTNTFLSIVAADLLFEEMQATNLRSAPFTISQCTTFSGDEGNCTSSKFQICDISFKSIKGTTRRG